MMLATKLQEAAANSTLPTYIEDVFSTYLYTGTGSNGLQIQNGIDLAGKGGLVFGKARSGTNAGSTDWGWVDTVRGGSSVLYSNSNVAAQATAQISSFNSNGFTLNGEFPLNYYGSPYTYGSWTFRKQPKFFDVLTYTGNGTAGTAISHSLGSTPGFILVKRTDTGGSTGQNWVVWHRSAGGTGYFNSTNALDSSFPNSIFWGNGSSYVAPTSTTFTVTDSQNVNASGGSYVAYLFAHDAGGFGLTGTDNVISCGSYVGNGSTDGPTITLGYEPQWILVKNATGAADWWIVDNMRGMPVGGNDWRLRPNTADEDNNGDPFFAPTATGFKLETLSSNVNTSGQTYIYIAIRRGPMKVPTSGTSVFKPVTQAVGGFVSTSFPVDSVLATTRDNVAYVGGFGLVDRLRGTNYYLLTPSTNADTNANTVLYGLNSSNVGYQDSALSGTGTNGIYYSFRRAPSFFDEVCYTGTYPTPQNINHNLGVAPELMIVKVRSVSGDDWAVYCSHLTDANIVNLRLNKTQAVDYNGDMWDATTPTATTFRVGQSVLSNYGGQKLVAYLFATCAGVSKVGSYVGTHDTTGPQTINCGFTSGARFVMIKIASSSSYGWWVFDTARGINPPLTGDPYLELNSTSAESTLDMINPDSSGFIAYREATNIQGQTYIYLAIA